MWKFDPINAKSGASGPDDSEAFLDELGLESDSAGYAPREARCLGADASYREAEQMRRATNPSLVSARGRPGEPGRAVRRGTRAGRVRAGQASRAGRSVGTSGPGEPAGTGEPDRGGPGESGPAGGPGQTGQARRAGRAGAGGPGLGWGVRRGG
ncbi:hypothetical protein Pflav_042250 [Phytohabitans flavus]|uniref:Uncharacterized protein n=1 Tax=Phytohabitans flavus TaxID=1076124 RepID=A0A6F8XVG0_9ACTN|nr:hypothetical protein Pflav_042250 [Phytohabitans flavus]